MAGSGTGARRCSLSWGSAVGVVATGPYVSWPAIQNPKAEPNGPVQEPEVVASTIIGLPGHPLRHVSLSNIRLVVEGGGTREDADREVPELPQTYPESNKFGRRPSGSSLRFRHVDGLTLRNVQVQTLAPEARPAVGFVDVTGLSWDQDGRAG